MHPADNGFLDGRGLITSELSFTFVCSADVHRRINDLSPLIIFHTLSFLDYINLIAFITNYYYKLLILFRQCAIMIKKVISIAQRIVSRHSTQSS